MKQAMALGLLLLLVPAQAGTATIEVPLSYSLQDMQGPGDLEISEYLFHGHRFIVASSSEGGSVALQFRDGNLTLVTSLDVPASNAADYDQDFLDIRGLILGVGDILQALEFPEAYDDADLRALVASNGFTQEDRQTQTERDQALLAAIEAQQPPSLLGLYSLHVMTLIALAGLALWKPKQTQTETPGQPAEVVMEPPNASSDH